MISKELKDRWLAALKSGKYEHTTGVLHDGNNCMCCLGVLADITDQWDDGSRSEVGGCMGEPAFVDELGLPLDDPWGLGEATMSKLVTANDEGGEYPIQMIEALPVAEDDQ